MLEELVRAKEQNLYNLQQDLGCFIVFPQADRQTEHIKPCIYRHSSKQRRRKKKGVILTD